MDILKELFGASDELQISLFGGDGGASSEEMGLGEPASPRSLGHAFLRAFRTDVAIAVRIMK